MSERLAKWVVALALAVAPIGATAQVAVSLATIPEKTLPGIPVAFRVTVSNPSAETLSLQNGVQIEVAASNSTFFAADDSGEPVWAPLDATTSAAINIAPGAHRDFFFSAGCSLADQPYFADARLTLPGSYSLRAKLLPNGGGDTPLWSAPASFIVTEPQGSDAAVWSAMLQRSARSGHSGFAASEWVASQFDLADEIYAKYPDSHYVPYVACFKRATTGQDRIALLQSALATSPEGPIADRLKLSMAAVHETLADHARATMDADRAVREMAEARQLVQAVQTDSVYPFLREEAAVAAAHLESDGDLRAAVAALQQDAAVSASPAVFPFVDCVSVRSGRLTARFGYRNVKSQTATIEMGSSNSISPADAAKRLPTSFRPGLHGNAFHATSAGEPIVWRLHGVDAVATNNDPRCSGNN